MPTLAGDANHRLRTGAKVIPIMLIEIWERLRGYDKWVETTATVESSKEQKIVIQGRYGPIESFAADDIIVWTDSRGERQYADFTADENSKLFQLIDNQTVSIRFNPSSPDQFYYRDLLKDKVRKFAQTSLVVLFVASFVALRIWAGIWKLRR
jgi:hypothetical protein